MTVRIGIFSLAHVHTEGYAGLLQHMDGVKFVGISDDDANRRSAIGGRLGAPLYDSHEALLKAGLDGVIICSETNRHLDLVRLAARHGVHILCEKPLEVDADRLKQLQDAVKDSDAGFMTAFPMRFDPSVVTVKQSVAAGELGRVVAVNGINHSEDPSAHRAWFADKTAAGGGAVMDHTVHLADLLRWMFAGEPVDVYAEIDPAPEDGKSADRYGLIQTTLDNGIFAAIDCSWSRPNPYPRWGHLKMEIVGEKGTITLDAFAQHLTVYSRGAARRPEWAQWGSDPNKAMLEEFVASIREGREPAIGLHDGLQATRLALAAYKSARQATPIRL